MKQLNKFRFITFLTLITFLSTCTPLIGPHSPIAYQNATSLKAETLALIEKATEPYDAHKSEVEQLFVEVNKAHEFVKGVPSNSISARQWEILVKPDGDLMGKFFSRWATSESKTLTPIYIGEFKHIISDAFDEIICLEANKKEAKQCNNNGAAL
jgi:hypothetical protein